LKIYEKGGIITNHYNSPYAPHKLTIGAGGIQIYRSGETLIKGEGGITASQAFLNIRLNSSGNLRIQSVIADNGRQKVGLRISGQHTNYSTVVLEGNAANTFTGDVEVSGTGTILALSKAQGVAASYGDFLIKSGSILELRRGSQISDPSTVTLRSGTLRLKWNENVRSEIFHKLAIEGDSQLQFESWKGIQSRLYLGELAIANGSLLEVQGWKAGRDWLLVKKTSKSLGNALKKIRFEGYDPNAIHLEDYNKDYWSISGTPEPSTYGTILASGALGLALFQGRRRERKNRSDTLDDVLT